MSEQVPKPLDPEQLRLRALSRWENEGGAASHGSQTDLATSEIPTPAPSVIKAELPQRPIREIAP